MIAGITEATTPSTRSNDGCIVSPLIDVFCICGGLMWVLFFFHQSLSGSSFQDQFGALSLTLSVMLAEAHVMATLLRLYDKGDISAKHPVFLQMTPLAICALIGLLCYSERLLILVTLLYVIASIHHGLRQTYGIALLYCRKSGFSITSSTRQLFSNFLHSVAVFATLRQFAYSEFSKSPLRGVDVAFTQVIPSWLVGFAALACVTLGGCLLLHLFIKQPAGPKQTPPLLAGILIANAVFVVIFSREIAGSLWIFVPGFFHGIQYLTLTILMEVGRAKCLASADSGNTVSTRISQYCVVLLILSAFTYGLLPRLLVALGVAFDTATATVFLAFVMHHFWADALIWKLRNPALLRAIDRMPTGHQSLQRFH